MTLTDITVMMSDYYACHPDYFGPLTVEVSIRAGGMPAERSSSSGWTKMISRTDIITDHFGTDCISTPRGDCQFSLGTLTTQPRLTAGQQYTLHFWTNAPSGEGFQTRNQAVLNTADITWQGSRIRNNFPVSRVDDSGNVADAGDSQVGHNGDSFFGAMGYCY